MSRVQLSTRWQVAALAAWLAILAAVSGRVLVQPATRTTYPIFSSSARLWWQGLDLYFPYRPESVQTGYRYCPAFAVLMTPLALLPDGPGGALWRCLGAAVLLGTLAWWVRAVLPRPVSREQVGLLALAIMPMALPSVNNGQANVLVAGLLLATTAAVAEARWNLASLCLGLAFVCKIYPLALGMVLVLLYPRPLAWRLALTVAAALVLPFLCQRPEYVCDQYGKWFELLQHDDRSNFGLDGAYRDLWLLLRQFEVPISYSWYRVLQAAGGAGVAALCWWRQRQGWAKRPLLTSTLALTTAWMLLLGPAPESCTYILLAPSLAWGALAALTPPRLTLGLVLILASVAIFLVAFSAGWFPQATEIHGKGLHAWATLLWTINLLQERRPCPASVPAANPRARAA